MKTWFVSERRKPTDLEASAAACTHQQHQQTRSEDDVDLFVSFSSLGIGCGARTIGNNRKIRPATTQPRDRYETRVDDSGLTNKRRSESGNPPARFRRLHDRVAFYGRRFGSGGTHLELASGRPYVEHFNRYGTHRRSRFIPGIIWHSGVGKLPSINVLYEFILSSFGYTKKPRVLIQSFEDRALAATKAFIHLKIQRKCLTGEDVAKRKDDKKLDEGPRLASPATFIPAEEGDLGSALGVLDYIEGRADFVLWEFYKFASAHQWLARILPYRCWDERRNELGIDVVLSSFVKHSFCPGRDASWSVMTDCLFMVYLQMGLPMHQDDLYILDKR